ncbi:MAG: hypothetical protein JW774_00510 [Candidatus Aureabacteria bacterium]|nr:hypothetical protein [Candidatus Auribacterota bacterium]
MDNFKSQLSFSHQPVLKSWKAFLTFASLAFILAGFIFEKNRVYSVGDGSVTTINGTDYIELATIDGLVLKAGKLYDAYSGEASKEEKDCKT